jgi:hypothetical protein
MAVRFQKSPSTLFRELQEGGYAPVPFSITLSARDAAGAEIPLANGVVVKWDRDSHSVWVEGPLNEASGVETYLRRRYECASQGPQPMRRWTAVAIFLLVTAIGVAVIVGLSRFR